MVNLQTLICILKTIIFSVGKRNENEGNKCIPALGQLRNECGELLAKGAVILDCILRRRQLVCQERDANVHGYAHLMCLRIRKTQPTVCQKAPYWPKLQTFELDMGFLRSSCIEACDAFLGRGEPGGAREDTIRGQRRARPLWKGTRKRLLSSYNLFAGGVEMNKGGQETHLHTIQQEMKE